MTTPSTLLADAAAALRKIVEFGDRSGMAKVKLYAGICASQIEQAIEMGKAADGPTDFLPLLLRDICRELGVDVPEAAAVLREAGLGDVSQGMAVTTIMARVLRERFEGRAAATPTPQAALLEALRNIEITGPDDDGLVWLVLHGNGTTGRAMFNLGFAERVAVQVAQHFEADRRAALAQAEAAQPVEPGFAFQVGSEYETQAGEKVRVIGRTTVYGAECLECSDGMYRYDRKGNSADAGRVTGTAHDYSFSGNFKRPAAPQPAEAAPKQEAVALLKIKALAAEFFAAKDRSLKDAGRIIMSIESAATEALVVQPQQPARGYCARPGEPCECAPEAQAGCVSWRQQPAPEPVAERAHNAGFVEAARIFGPQIERMQNALRSIREHCAAQPSALAAAIVATCDNGLAAAPQTPTVGRDCGSCRLADSDGIPLSKTCTISCAPTPNGKGALHQPLNGGQR